MYTKRDHAFGADLEQRFGDRYRYVGDELRRTLGGQHLMRPGAVIARYVVHHLGGGESWRAEDVWRFHVRRMGWSTAGYNVLIDRTGGVEVLIPPSHMSYGAGARWNPTSAHIAVAGNYEMQQPTGEQLDAIYGVLCAMDDCYGYAPWRCHQELKRTACPGRWLIPHVTKMRGGKYGAAPDFRRERPKRYP